MIEIKGLHFRINDKIILDNINLKILPGDFWLIFGPNGAGKTTLFKIMAGLISDYGGNIRIHSRNIRGQSRREMARNLAYLPQFDEFSLPLSVRDILLCGRYPYTSFFKDYSARDQSLVDEAVERFNLKDLVNRDINTLSGGERKKTMLASAFIQDVSIILLDEPFTFLDPLSIAGLKGLLKTLHHQGKTVVVISHQIESLFSMADKTAAIKAGKLVYSGPRRFDPLVLEKTYGIRYRRLHSGNRDIIYIDE